MFVIIYLELLSNCWKIRDRLSSFIISSF